MTSPIPVAVVGPTAGGKSDLALDLAERLDGEIVNLDAMQQYRGMDIGTAKLTPAERRGIPHHQIDVLDVTETATVARYQQAATDDVERLLSAGRTPVLVGGSMMYMQGLLDNWQFPATDPAVREKYEAMLGDIGVARLHRRLAEVDPQAASAILDTDGRRIVRALEVVEITGMPFAASAPTIGDPRWGTRIVALDRETAALDERIRSRTSRMFADGLEAEVRALCELGLREGRTASRAIGYAQVLAALDGDYDMATAEELTFVGTRRYVRRQRSWFRRDHRIVWLDAGAPDLLTTALRAIGNG
ncbi:tRNA (adenosine(37)-N6)-dimethylallyltransferase MiaA [Gordonia sp. SID5947]|uniref:tRNA (adenosine(37)-N6)-dimethylallyltransferase MiaA n=1 Tax=Gordonia sp. SID5947 TaxID=2690315 RepID=UPI00136D3007|nr:tRNA (adenosine(37)-N6)-dimethylallyltransferase MiaA [Gordonia sp. SID5947]MYR05830.1 tRNA (adenosine(37)-N6)-dimethylallyltransferase MiaA [Gordonia sp. SID5947]